MVWGEIVLCALAGVVASVLVSRVVRWSEAKPWRMRVGVGNDVLELDLAHARESQSLLEAKRRALAEQPRIAPAEADELLIIVARFQGLEEIDPQQYIGRRLESELALHPALRGRVRIARYHDAIEGETHAAEREKAAAIGEAHGATLVIWGQHDVHRISPCYLVTRRHESAPMSVGLEERRARFVELDEFIVHVPTGLPEAITRLSLFTMGQMYYFAGWYEAAVSLLGSALQRLPSGQPNVDGQAPLCFYRATAYAKLGEYARAIADYDRAIEADPERAVLYANRGAAYASLGRYGWAVADYGQAIQVDPQEAEFYANRGAAYAYVGDYGRAIQDLERAVEIAPEEAGFQYTRACAEGLRGYVSGAIDWLGRAIELDARYVQILATDPHLDRVRDDLRFKRFLAKVGR